jgi:hypothetical protein
MTRKTKRMIKMVRAGQRGSAMILVLIFMALAGLIVPPMLAHMSTGLKTGMIFEENTRTLYAAESGVTDGLWYVSYGDIGELFTTYKQYGFYAYSPTYEWSYTVDETINDREVEVAVQNIWMPQNVAAPPEAEARGIIEAGKLILTSSANSSTEYEIEAVFYPEAGENLTVASLGVWLPPGYSYVPNSSLLELEGPGATYYPDSVQDIPWASGRAIIWELNEVPFTEFGPLVDDSSYPIVATLGFNYTTAEPNMPLPAGIAWMTTDGVASVPYTWDADVKVYHIKSTAESETVEVYATRSEMRQLGAAVKGDYCAVGNVLETATGDPNYRDRLLRESEAVVDTGTGLGEIPEMASIRDAWLYWSGWTNDLHEVAVWSDGCSDLGNWSTASSMETIWSDDGSSMTNWSTQTSWQTVWGPDTCGSFTGWVNGGDWALDNGRFRGHHSSGDRYLTRSTDINLSAYAGRQVRITWEQSESYGLETDDGMDYYLYNGTTWNGPYTAFRHGSITSPFTVNLASQYLVPNFKIRFYLVNVGGSSEYIYIDNIKIEASTADWEISGGQFRGNHVSGDRTLTRSANIDLHSYAGQTVTISWDQSKGGTLESSDILRFSFSNNGGSTWSGTGSSQWEAFRGPNNPATPYTYTIPGNYLTSSFRVRYYLDGFNESGEYAYIDNIRIEASSTGDWDVYNGQFRGHHYSSHDEDDRILEMDTAVDLSSYVGKMMTISWDQDEGGNLGSADGLEFSISGNDGATWSDQIEAFHNDNPESPFTYTIPASYLTSGFKIKFYLDIMSGADQYAYIDDISISQADMGVDRVVFNGTVVTADTQQAKENTFSGNPTGTWSYSCSYDATELVKQMIADNDLDPNGAGDYVVGHVLESRPGSTSYNLFPSGSTGYPVAIPSGSAGSYGQFTYAAWSLILIYTSPETEGHQIYLYDDFDFVENASIILPVSGFLAPSDNATLAGSSATFFVGEGDAGYGSHQIGSDEDGVYFNGSPLSDAINPHDNVWNSYSNALDDTHINGIDLDTFDVSPYIHTNDTSAEVELYSTFEIYNVIYVILSFRSDSEFGGVITFLIGD